MNMLSPWMPPACQRAREAVSLQLDGELSEVGSASLSSHLRECDACTAYALELAAVTSRLRTAPLQRPSVPVELPSRQGRPALQLAAAAAALVAVAASSLALSHALTSSGRPARTATQSVNAPTIGQDIVSQHILAMERRLPRTESLRIGPLLAL